MIDEIKQKHSLKLEKKLLKIKIKKQSQRADEEIQMIKKKSAIKLAKAIEIAERKISELNLLEIS